MSARVFELEGSLSFDSSGFYKAVQEAVEAGEKLKQELERNDKAMESMEKAVADTDKALQKVEDSTSDFTKETKESTSATADLDKKMDSLNETYSDSEKQVEELKKELEKVRKESGENSNETKKLAEKLEEAEKESEDLRKQVKELEDRYKSAQDETKKLDTKTKDLGGTMENAGEKFKKFAEFMKNGLVAGIAAGTAAIASAGAAVVGVIKKVGDTAEYGDNIDKMSQKLNMSAEAYQEWDFIMQHCGSTIEAMQGGMKTLAMAAETNSDAFEQLGLSQSDIANMSQEELFGATIKALQNVTDESERTYLASKLLGRGGTELGALLNTSAEDVEAMRQQVHDLGGVMSNEAVKQAAEFQDSLQDMKTSMQGLTRGIFSDLMPSLSTAMQGITGIFSGDSENGLEKLSQGVSSFVNDLSAKLPKVIEAGGDIISSLAEGVADKLPQLINTMTGSLSVVITKLVSKIKDGKVIKQVSESAKTMFSGLITGAKDIIIGLTSALPSLLVTVGRTLSGEDGIIKQIGGALKEAIPAVLDNILDIGEVILDVLPDIISDIGEVITDLLPEIFPKVLETFWTLIDMIASSDLFASVADLIMPLMEALLSAAEKAYPIVFELIPKVIEDLLTTIGTYFDENSDTITEQLETFILHLIDFAKGYIPALLGVMKDIIVALAGGLIDNIPKVYEPFENAFEHLGEWLFEVSEKIKNWFAEIIGKAVTFFEDLGGKLYDWREERIEKLRDFITSIIQKVKDFKNDIAEKIGEIIGNISDKFTGLLASAKNWGRDLIDNFVGGITDKIGKVTSAISGVTDTIGQYIHFSEPDKGALADFHTFAPDMMNLFAQGIKDNASLVYDEINALTKGISSDFAVEASPVAPAVATNGAVNNYSVNISFDGANISENTDLDNLSDTLIEKISEGLAMLDVFQTRAYGGVTI